MVAAFRTDPRLHAEKHLAIADKMFQHGVFRGEVKQLATIIEFHRYSSFRCFRIWYYYLMLICQVILIIRYLFSFVNTPAAFTYLIGA